MDLVNIYQTYDVYDEPRYLTEDEMNTILNALPPIMSPDPATQKNVDVALKHNLKTIFKANRVAPSAIQSIVDQIHDSFVNAHVIPGTAVGIHAAEGASRAPSQMSMDTFKTVGDSKAAAQSVSEVEELLYVKKDREYEICTLYYKDVYLTYEQVLESRHHIVECMVKDIMYEMNDTKSDSYIIDTYKNLIKKWWHNDYYFTEVLDNTIPNEEDYFMRIYLDTNKMYKFKITLQDIVDKIKESNENYQLYYGSIDDGIIDIHVFLKYVESKKSKPEERLYDIVLASPKDRNLIDDMFTISSYYLNTLLSTVKNIKIKGIAGITSLVPIIVPVLSVVLDEKKMYMVNMNEDDEDVFVLLELLDIQVISQGNTYFLVIPDNKLTPVEYIEKIFAEDKKSWSQKNIITVFNKFKKYPSTLVYSMLLSHRKMRKYNIDVERFRKMFDLTDINILYQLIKEDDNVEMIVEYKSVNKDIGPRAYINGLIVEDEKVRKEKKSGTKLISTKLMDLSELITAEVTGTNLKGLMGVDFLDKTRLKSNNIHVTASVLGIEAAQAAFIEDVQLILASYGLHPQHILTIAYLFFAKGIPTGAMFNSINKPYGPMDKATVSKAVDVMKTSALQGLSHDANGISTGIVLGLAPKIGTNYYDVGYEQGNEIILNDDIYNHFKQKQNEMDDEHGVVMPVMPKNRYEDDDVNITMKEAIIEKRSVPNTLTRAPLMGKKLGRAIEKEAEIVQKITEKEETKEPEIMAKSGAKKKNVEEEIIITKPTTTQPTTKSTTTQPKSTTKPTPTVQPKATTKSTTTARSRKSNK